MTPLNDDYSVRSTGFRREVVASGTFTQTITGGTPQPDAQINLEYSLNTKSNWQASQTDLEYILQQGGRDPQDLKYKRISVPILAISDITDSEPGNWLNIYSSALQKLADVSKLTGLDPIGTGKDVGVVTVGKALVENYKNLPIVKAGTVDLNGQEAVKYVMYLSGDDIMQVYGKNSSTNLFEDIFDQGYSYEVDLYVVGNALVRQEYHFSGGDSQENLSGQVNVTMDLAIDYQNLGTQLPITLDNGITVAPKA